MHALYEKREFTEVIEGQNIRPALKHRILIFFPKVEFVAGYLHVTNSTKMM